MFPDEIRLKFLGYISDFWDYDNKRGNYVFKDTTKNPE